MNRRVDERSNERHKLQKPPGLCQQSKPCQTFHSFLALPFVPSIRLLSLTQHSPAIPDTAFACNPWHSIRLLSLTHHSPVIPDTAFACYPWHSSASLSRPNPNVRILLAWPYPYFLAPSLSLALPSPRPNSNPPSPATQRWACYPWQSSANPESTQPSCPNHIHGTQTMLTADKVHKIHLLGPWPQT
ncbi:hypothetical protein T492DRAFT_128796 [Pavlovales sp. CCMP2436]|nr:hypothetical protein T492DRAFT_128796 [Pavlovales sp. CCMP2436]